MEKEKILTVVSSINRDNLDKVKKDAAKYIDIYEFENGNRLDGWVGVEMSQEDYKRDFYDLNPIEFMGAIFDVPEHSDYKDGVFPYVFIFGDRDMTLVDAYHEELIDMRNSLKKTLDKIKNNKPH